MNIGQDSFLSQPLKAQLETLSFHAFEQCIRELLKAMGYAQVELLGRTHTRQFTKHGGLDMQARSRLGVTETPVILQLKQYKRAVSRRFVDELRGTMLRRQAGHGLIITTGAFSTVAHKAALENRLAPVRLIDGEELTSLLCEHTIGIRRKGKKGWTLDRNYFDRLRKKYPDKKRNSRREQSNVREENKEANISANLQGGTVLWRTHVLAGIGSLWLLQLLPGGLTNENVAVAIGLSTLGALLPDLDAGEAKIKHIRVGGVQPFAPVSALMHKTFGHRGRLHSLAALLVATAIFLPLGLWWGWTAPLALSLGYASHLALDACTKTGIPALKPDKRFYMLPKGLRITTGSLAEEAIIPLLVLVVIVLLLRFMPGL